MRHPVDGLGHRLGGHRQDGHPARVDLDRDRALALWDLDVEDGALAGVAER